jgi:PAS domain S-box-containing protein
MMKFFSRHASQTILWLCMLIVIATVTLSAFHTNITLKSVEKTLPNALLTELNSLSLALEKIADIVTAVEVARATRDQQDIRKLKERIDIAQDTIIELRDTYVTDNLVNASAFHAVIAPAIVDLRIWLTEGVSGFKPDSSTTLQIAETRIVKAYQRASNLNHRSQATALEILDQQKQRLERFQANTRILFLLTLIVVGFLIFFLIRQTLLISRELKTKEKLGEQNDLLNSLLQNLPLGVAVWDKEGNNIHLNAQFTEITGYSRDELPRIQSWSENAYPDPQYRQYVRKHWANLDKRTKIAEYRVTCRDGTEKEIAFRATFLPDSRIINTLIDVTERNLREQALAESRKQEARSKKMESLGLLAGGVAHDLNNILSGIVSYPELLMLELPEGSAMRRSIEIIRNSGQKAAAIVQDLLTMARGAAIAKEPVNLNDIIREYVSSPDCKQLARLYPGTRISLSLAANLPNVLGSKVHIRKMLMNLTTNACEAIIKPEGLVSISTTDIYIDSSLPGFTNVKEGGYVALSVTDDGGGIEVLDLERIFEPFYTKKIMGRSGTGLGLAVVWNVVQDHLGYVNVSSSESGTTFNVYLPITDQLQIISEERVDFNRLKGNGESILVIDDVSVQRIITTKILEKMGYVVESVASGEAAIELLAKRKVDLLVLDMIMEPGINGQETYRKILEIHPGQKAIIVSGFAETDEVKETLRLGADCFLKKPLNIHDLGLAVANILKR